MIWTLTPIALFALTLSFASGCKRIQLITEYVKQNRLSMRDYEDSIHITETLNTLTPPYINATGEQITTEQLKINRQLHTESMKDADKKMETLEKFAVSYGRARDIFLIFGFLLILASKVFQPYIESK